MARDAGSGSARAGNAAAEGLDGWSLPLSPGGRAALVPPPPWHFSGDVLGIDFRCDPAEAAAVLPPGLEAAGDGSASFVFCDWSSSADSDPRLAADPARGQYREAYVTVGARLDGRSVGRVPYIWVDSDLSLARGHIQGFPKKLGAVAITRAVTVGRGGPRLEPGATFAGHVSSLGRMLACGSVTLAEPAEPGFVPRAMRLPLWHTRMLPDLTGGPPLGRDLVRNIITDFSVAQVWTGTGTLSCCDSEFEELSRLRPVEITGGFRCSVAFTITGAETRSAH
jgi:acetoacetate decarboxylase